MNLGKEPSELARTFMPDVFKFIDALTVLARWFFDCIAVNVFTLIRFNFGERFMTLVNWFVGASVFSTFTAFAALAGSPKTLFWRAIWGPAVLVCFAYHRWVIRKRNRAAVLWHSESAGISHLTRIPIVRQFVPDEVIEKWLEPGLILLAAWLISMLDRGFASYLVIVAIALCLRAQIAYNLQRQQSLSDRDRRIESMFFEAVLADKPPDETAGFTIAASNRMLFRQEVAASEAQPEAQGVPLVESSTRA